MAIDLLAQYPGKVGPVVPLLWPYGEPRNITAPGDGKGTPWEAALVKDIVGFQQALLSDPNAAIIPTGTPETANASQYLQALKKILKPVGMEVKARLHSTTANTTTFTIGNAIIFDDTTPETFDIDSVYDNTTGGYKPTVAGYYEINFSLDVQGWVGSHAFYLANGFTQISNTTGSSSDTGNHTVADSALIHLNGTTDEIFLRVQTGGNVSLFNDFVNSGWTEFSAKLIRAD